MATVEEVVRIERGSSGDIDAVMTVMDAAFGRSFGEAWTRSSCPCLPEQGCCC